MGAERSIPERRRLHRVRGALAARFETAASTGRGSVENLSPGGLFLRTGELPRPGESVALLVEEGGRTLRLEGEVRWTTARGAGVDAGFGVALRAGAADHATWLAEVVAPAVEDDA